MTPINLEKEKFHEEEDKTNNSNARNEKNIDNSIKNYIKFNNFMKNSASNE